MKFVVNDIEVLAEDGAWDNGYQLMLYILKKKQAPIDGALILKVKPDYKVTFWRDEIKRQSHFRFDKIPTVSDQYNTFKNGERYM